MSFPDFPNFPNVPDTSTTITSSVSNNGCTLSPSASAFSSMLSAFIGSVVNGLTSGWLVAFMTGWIAWLAIFRVLLTGSYMFYRSSTDSWGPGKHQQIPNSQPEDPGYLMQEVIPQSETGEQVVYPPGNLTTPATNWRNYIWPPAAIVRCNDQDYQLRRRVGSKVLQSMQDLSRDVTILGWIGWVYAAIFAPITQSLWVAANISDTSIGVAKIVKGLTIAVTALPLGIDCRVRYADSLKWKWAGVWFNLTNSISCLVQAIFCATLLIDGVLNLRAHSYFPLPVAFIYPIFSIVWMLASFAFLPMRDGGRKKAGDAHWAGYFFDVFIGAFAGVFLAAPAFALYQSAQFDKVVAGGDQTSGMQDLASYLSCETQFWKKIAAVVP